MLCNLNEKYLLKFISNANFSDGVEKKDLLELLCANGIKVKFDSINPVYDIIDKFEYSGIYYESELALKRPEAL